MNKRELVEAVAESAGLTLADADRAVNAVVAATSKAVAEGDRVTVPDLGTFERRDRAARTGRNPQTGETLEIAATRVPGFKPASAFKKLVANGKA